MTEVFDLIARWRDAGCAGGRPVTGAQGPPHGHPNAWRKSSRCGANAGCVEVAVWRKATASHANGSCVEAAQLEHGVGIRDSKLGDGSPVLVMSRDEFRRWVNNIKFIAAWCDLIANAGRRQAREETKDLSPSAHGYSVQPDPWADDGINHDHTGCPHEVTT